MLVVDGDVGGAGGRQRDDGLGTGGIELPRATATHGPTGGIELAGRNQARFFVGLRNTQRQGRNGCGGAGGASGDGMRCYGTCFHAPMIEGGEG